jgi:hypothetical protein
MSLKGLVIVMNISTKQLKQIKTGLMVMLSLYKKNVVSVFVMAFSAGCIELY